MPAFAGASARPTAAPPAGAGMSRVTVNVNLPPGATTAGLGVMETTEGCSAAPTTLTLAWSDDAPTVAVSVTFGD